MTISIGVLTYNMFLTSRATLFWKCLSSIQRETTEHTLDVVTNGSTDGTDKVVRQLGGIVDDTVRQSWYGFELAIRAALRHGPDIVVLSADDLEYHPGWLDAVDTFWQHAPEDVKLATLFVEPEWEWSRVTGAIDVAGLRVLIRENAPSASWSFRAHDAGLILPLPRIMPGEDHAVCQRIKEQGYRLAALDLAEHIGETVSAWGNQSHLRPDMVPASAVKRKWGLA